VSFFSSEKFAGDHPLLDPLVAMLLLIALLLTWGQLQQHAKMPDVAQAGAGARIFELRWAVGTTLSKPHDPSADPPKNPWDAAVEALLLAEDGRIAKARELLRHTPEGAFRICWEAAHASGPMPSEQELALVVDGLSGGLASRYLEASMMRGEGAETKAKEIISDALKQYVTKAIILFVLMIIFIAGAISGIAKGIGMWANRKRFLPLQDSPYFQMSYTSVVRVCLGWYVVFLLSSTIIGLLSSFFPMGVWILPTTYIIHATLGIVMICAAESISPATLLGRISRKGWSWLPKGIGFLVLAMGLVSVLAILLSLVVPEGEDAQKGLTDFIRVNSGVVSFFALLGTVAIIGPVFEEIFFRGFLLSILRRRMSVWWALALSSAIFGAFHLQLQTLPVLMLLGGIMGLAFLQTRDIRTAIFVHACWNGGVFLFQKVLLG
jgi:membrane protease YdiL (CAAX protease family)